MHQTVSSSIRTWKAEVKLLLVQRAWVKSTHFCFAESVLSLHIVTDVTVKHSSFRDAPIVPLPSAKTVSLHFLLLGPQARQKKLWLVAKLAPLKAV